MTDTSYLLQYFLEHSPKENEPKTKTGPVPRSAETKKKETKETK